MHSDSEHNTDRCNLLQSHSTAQLIYNVTKTLPRRARILFIGCESSLPLIHHLASAGHEIHGTDESKDAIALARQFPGDYHLISPVEYYPPFEFDAIFAIHSLHHLSHAQIEEMISHLGRWLKKDGSLTLVTPLLTPLPVDSTGASGLNSSTAKSSLNRDSWLALCRTAGLSPPDSEATIPVPLNATESSQTHCFMSFHKI
ncbi:S-adenosyl-L-methionine-dependent methyltransferase [Aspergillus nidulans var. acristatus]